MLNNFHRIAVNQLPMIAAKALMEGFAMEIMDKESITHTLNLGKGYYQMS